MAWGIDRVGFSLFAVNAFYLLYGLGLIVFGVFVLPPPLDRTPDLADEIRSVAIGFIILGVITVAVTSVGFYGATKNIYCMILTYAVLLLATLVIKAILFSLAFGVYNHVITYDIDKFSDDFKKSLANYSLTYTARDYIDEQQSKLSCCGITGPSDFYQTIPTSCCKADVMDASCNSITAYQVGCPLRYTGLTLVTYKLASWVFGLLSTGVVVAVLFAVVRVIQLANAIKNTPEINRSRYNFNEIEATSGATKGGTIETS